VQQRGRQRLFVEVERREDLRRSPGMADERLAGTAPLAVVSALGVGERTAEQIPVDVGLVRLDVGNQLL
jgi:hypothetical protein